LTILQAPSEPVVVLDARVVTGAGGGPDKTILRSPPYLARAGYRMLCAYLHPPGDPGFDELKRKAEAWQAPLREIVDRGPWDWRPFSELLSICRHENVAVWHGHDYKSNLLGLMLRPFWPMRLVTTAHGWVEHTSRTPLYYRIDRLCLPRYERVLCVSPDLHEECLACGVPASRCALVENGIEVSEFTRSRTGPEAKRTLGQPPERLLIGAVGRLSAEKGFDVLIGAVADLVRAGLDVGLVIAGEGKERATLEALAAELCLSERVWLPGYLSDPRLLYEALDVFALSSLREGLPNVLLEAMAMAVPVVATRVAGVPRLVRHEQNGLLIEPASPQALAGGLALLLRQPALRLRLGRAGRATVEAEYSFTSRMQKVAAIYDDLLDRTPFARNHAQQEPGTSSHCDALAHG
jgi:glycosyltransferase involved in cell wall biosynthesis